MEVTHRRALSVVVGFLVAFLVLGLLVGVVGVADVLVALRSATRLGVGAAFLVALLWLSAWSYTLHLVLGVLGLTDSRRGSLLVFLNVVFANNIAPFSVGGGEPIAALLVSRSTRSSYETALLAVVSTDVMNYLPAPVLAFLGLLFVASTTALGHRMEVVVGTLFGISALLGVLGVLGWRYRRRIEANTVGGLLAMQRVAGRVVPGIGRLSPDGFQTRVGAFVDGLERVATDRRVLLLGLGSSTLGWLLQAAVLWLALYAVGARVPVEVPVFVVTLVTVTDLVPLPGGLGTVDATLVVLIVAVTGIPAATATAAALVFRSATLLFPIVLGGVAVAVLQVSPAVPD